MGATVFGAVNRERIQLNEETLWMGGPRETDNPEALLALPEVRRLLFAGQPREAYALAERKLMGRPWRLESYQSLADLRLAFDHEGTISEYRRELDLDEAVAHLEQACAVERSFGAIPWLARSESRLAEARGQWTEKAYSRLLGVPNPKFE